MWDLAEYANPPFDAAADGNVTACVAARRRRRVGRPGVPGAQPPHLRRAAAAHRAVRHGAALLPRRAAAADRPKDGRSGYLCLVALGLVFWGGGFAIWYTQPRTVRSPLEDGPIEERYWAGGFPADTWREHDQLWIGIMIWLQFGYPIVSAIEFAWCRPRRAAGSR